MTAPAHHSSARSYDDYEAGDHFAHEELWPGERIGPPPSRTGRKRLLRGAMLLIVLGGGWVLVGDRVDWRDWASWLQDEAPKAVAAWMERRPSAPSVPTASALSSSLTPTSATSPAKPIVFDRLPPVTPEPAGAPSETPGTATRAAALPPPAKGSDEAPPSPLPPPESSPNDPYAARAAAVGLHPDLSRVLLARLSATDYRNAGVAIQTAMAETPDKGVFVYPRQRKPELALFQVKFVAGAAPDCRRYVVSITKDGWLTTALPMEKCGSQAVRGPRETRAPSTR